MRIVSCLALASLLLVPSVCAQTLQMSPGSVCRPAMADDVAKLDFSEGGARNVFDAPGTVAQTATVVCPLPLVPPGYVISGASVALYDPANRPSRARCFFMPMYAGWDGVWVPVKPEPDAPWIKLAELDVDPSRFRPAAVRCPVLPGQFLYGVRISADPVGR